MLRCKSLIIISQLPSYSSKKKNPKFKLGVVKHGSVELTANDTELRISTFVTKCTYSLLMKMKNTARDEE